MMIGLETTTIIINKTAPEKTRTNKWYGFFQEVVNPLSEATEASPKSRECIKKLTETVDQLNPVLTAGTLLLGGVMGTHLNLGIPIAPIQDGIAISSILKPTPAILSFNLERMQSELNEHDGHAYDIRQLQLATNLASNLLRVQSAGFSAAGLILPAVGVGSAAVLATAGTALGLGAGGLSAIAGGIGIYYYSYKIQQANKQKAVLQSWADELAIYRQMLNTINTNQQAELNSDAGKIEKGDKSQQFILCQLKLKLSKSVNNLPRGNDYKNAWQQLIKDSISKDELFKNIRTGISQVTDFISGRELATEPKNNNLKSLQAAIKTDTKHQTLRQLIDKDPSFTRQKKMYQNFNKLESGKLAEELSHAGEQTQLDIKKKQLEVKKSAFWLSMTATGLIISGLMLTAGSLSLAHTPPAAIAGLTIAAGLLSIGVACCVYEYYKLTRAANNKLEAEQKKLDKEKVNLLSEPVLQEANQPGLRLQPVNALESAKQHPV